MLRRRRFRSVVVLALAVALAAGLGFASSVSPHRRSRSDKDLSRIGHRKIARGPTFFLKNEAAVGKAYSESSERHTILQHDPEVSDYLEHLEQALVRNSDADLPVTLRVIDSQQVISFTLPGGYQYVSLGLLLRLESEGELTSILARGIAHTALHSAAREETREQFAKLANIPLIVTGSSLVAPDAPAQSTPLTLLGWKRQDELDADYFGVQYVYKAGYDPKCFLQALQRVWGDEEASSVSSAIALRPLPRLADRTRAVQKEIEELLPTRASSVVTTPEFEQFRARLRTLRPDTAPKSSGSEARPALLGKPPSW